MLFGRKKCRRLEDRVWLEKVDKYRGICEEIMREGGSGKKEAVLIFAHFRQTVDELETSLGGQGIPHTTLSRAADLAGTLFASFSGEYGGNVILLSEALEGRYEFQALHDPGSWKGKRLHILVAEHYPIPDRDEDLLKFADSLPLKCALSFHVSFDEPLLKNFSGASLVVLLRKMGLVGGKALEHPAVTRAILGAQKRVKKGASGDCRAGSMEEWFFYNHKSDEMKLER